MSDDEESAVQAVYAALADRDEGALRLLLHPYLCWTGPDGVTTRGRTKVLGVLSDRSEPPPLPASIALRDGQIYRWRSR